ncbi:MAG: RluA family pseudouridine synthase [Brevefilum sp.]|nr:RluA family pseudouridine synthase [Brevefilum sp.]
MKQTTFFFTNQSNEEVRVDKFLADQLPDISRSHVQRMIEAGNVRLDGLVVEKAGVKAKPGGVLEILVIEENLDGLIPEAIPFAILYEDDHVIVVDKPAGMVVHPGAGNSGGTLVNALLAYFPPIRQVGELDRPGVVHRLDKETSGVIIFAKSDKAYRWLVREFKSRDVHKTYLALVDGHPPTPTGRIEAPVVRDTRSRTRMSVGLRGQGRPAVSEYYTLEKFTKHTYLEVHPVTGRTHQIRLHLNYIGVPVVGDTLYGRRNPSIAMDRFFLHAKTLTLRLPGDRTARTFEAPLPEELQIVLTDLHNREELAQ